MTNTPGNSVYDLNFDDKGGLTSDSEDSFDEADELLDSSEEEPDVENGFTSLSPATHVETVESMMIDSNNCSTEFSSQPESIVDDLDKRKYIFKRRKANPRTTSTLRDRWSERGNNLQANELEKMRCCKKLKCFRTINKDFLIQKIKLFLKMTPANRRRELASMYGSCGKFFFDGQKVCANFLFEAFRFSRKVQASVRSICESALNASSGNELLASTDQERGLCSNPNSSAILNSPGKEAIMSYLIRLAESTGDKMPDSDERHLPFHTKNEVFGHFKEDFKRTASSTLEGLPSLAYFLRIWKSECRFIKIRKNNRFSKCEICEKLKDEMKRAITTFESTAPILLQKKAHYAMIAQERQEYKRKRDQAIMHPNEVLSFIIDGADQHAFGLPHFISHTKAERGHTLTIKLVGVLEHAVENKLRLLTMSEEHQTGANHIIESIHRFLMDKSLSCQLPPKLYIQVDNCTRENKNRFFFSYIESLIRWELFHEVEVGFLPVGHTHEDIDQAFSTTSARLRVNEAITLKDLLNQLRQVYNRHTSVVHMKNIINWSGLCEQENILTSIKNFSVYRYFNFSQRKEGTSNDQNCGLSVQCMVKVNVNDDWETLRNSFMTEVPDLSKTPPTVIESTTNKNFNKLKSNFTKRLESEESRIMVPSKIGELKDLRDSIFRPRKIRFHWDVKRTVELQNMKGPDGDGKKKTSANNNDESLEGDSENESEIITKSLPQGDGKTHNNPIEKVSCSGSYTYEINSFVAILAETADNSPTFWIGKVINAKEGNNGDITKLNVHWFEPYSRNKESLNFTNKFHDKYAASYLDKGSSKERPWVNNIETSAVLVNFSPLLENRRLPSAVQRHLRVLLPTVQK